MHFYCLCTAVRAYSLPVFHIPSVRFCCCCCFCCPCRVCQCLCICEIALERNCFIVFVCFRVTRVDHWCCSDRTDDGSWPELFRMASSVRHHICQAFICERHTTNLGWKALRASEPRECRRENVHARPAPFICKPLISRVPVPVLDSD